MPEELRKKLTASLEATASTAHHEAVDARLARARGKRKTLQAMALRTPDWLPSDRNLRSLRLERQEVREDIAGIEQQLSEIGEDKLRALTSERNERQAQILRDKERLEEAPSSLASRNGDEDLKRRLRKQPVGPTTRSS